MKKINKGWSSDKKYLLSKDSKLYLLRLSKKEEYTRRKRDFHILTELHKNTGIPMSVPVKFGELKDKSYTYILYTWLIGDDARKVIRNCTEKEKIEYGKLAGIYQRKIHEYSSCGMNWEEFFNKKIDSKIESYRNCGIPIYNEQDIINYIDSNRYLLSNRPVTLQHGDYHIDNMIINTDNNQLCIIDFDRLDYGDPWEEFSRIVWCKESSSNFAYGRIQGYFSGEPPIQFWKTLGLYMAFNMISSVAWSVNFGQKEINAMVQQAKDTSDMYCGFNEIIPDWYRDVCH